MAFWYTIDNPRNKPCWAVNPALWEFFRDHMESNAGVKLHRHEIYTEAYVVQFLDNQRDNERMDENEA